MPETDAFEEQFTEWSKQFDQVDLDNMTSRMFKNICRFWYDSGKSDGLSRGIEAIDKAIREYD